ncbi:MAG: hypothetical protein CL840_20360 [Crocinitomicaceae bacterium]|nr:hypothetical protein [Crocinitomicaceae bacterium]|tara:strand:+ start:7895 stop:11359 length:3465 start_codon:yes stop_codon:yes gene_type:complete
MKFLASTTVKREFHGVLGLAALLFITACNSSPQDKPDTQFSKIDAKASQLTFVNQIQEKENFNYFIHTGFYNGAGVAAGDINNDGLVDLYFCGNQVNDALYLNTGDLTFQDISVESNIQSNTGWSSGVTMVDINSDGYLDIYVCRYLSSHANESTQNLLYINNHDNTFIEEGQKYGIADKGNSVHATFFDYDLDGDLDLYVLNQPTGYRSLKQKERETDPDRASDRMYRNNGDRSFTDITLEAGMINYGYGLGVVVGDIDKNGYPDLLVANDYDTPDFVYLNTGENNFIRVEDIVFKHMSNFSMGMDLADINNDDGLDVFVVDMLAKDHYRQKVNMGAMNEEKFWAMVDSGRHYQYMRNVLQLNNNNGSFSEIGQMAGVSKTDWSWAALVADLNNNGWKDLFVSNGILRDVRNNDAQKDSITNSLDHSLSFPSTPIVNAVFSNNKDLTFSSVSKDWGITDSTFSNGALYSDLDNDGDLDLVVNNVNQSVGLYRNNNLEANNWLQLQFNGTEQGRGVQVKLYTDQEIQFQEHTLERGYMSAVSNIMHFGVGKVETIDKMVVQWPDGEEEILSDIDVNQRIQLDITSAGIPKKTGLNPTQLFGLQNEELGVKWEHQENKFNDFKNGALLPHKLSQFGPGIAVGDVNGDGEDDFYVGGARGQSGQLYVKGSSGKFEAKFSVALEKDSLYEDMGALFFDADQDGDNDLYVVSGSNSFESDSEHYQDRFYLNDGEGNYTRAINQLPKMRSSGSCVVAGDMDRDGDLDLFVGGRVSPGNYPYPARNYLLENNQGTFSELPGDKIPEIETTGMVSSALWTDYDNDSDLDLIVVGEWMPITVFENTDAGFVNATQKLGLEKTNGWWNSIVGGDFDNDGDVDYVVGNAGLNTKFHPTPEEPLELYSSDFDGNQQLDIVLAKHHKGAVYPVRGRECSSAQIPEIKQSYKDYHSFAISTLKKIYTEEKLSKAYHLSAYTFASSYIENVGGSFEVHPLPNLAQISTTFGMLAYDFTLDGNLDLLITGNFYAPEVETGRQDAGIGLLLVGDGSGNFEPKPSSETKFFSDRDGKGMAMLYDGIFPVILVANNNGPLELHKYAKATGRGSAFLPGESIALHHLNNGKVQRVERYYGAGYLSQSGNFVPFGKNTEKIVFQDQSGGLRTVD